MVGQRTGVILRQMQALIDAGTLVGLSDQQLLERFLERRDEAAELAFAVLVERHGPMVLGVCRRIVGDLNAADDAFQATFLVLARRARSIHVDGSLGRWLFGVANRVATRARSDDRRRRARERPGLDRLDAVGSRAEPDAVDRAEIRAAILQEIAGLPGRYQAPVLLCDLEGTSCEEAARRLGWPLGTVKSRLSRARARLRDRLTRRGLTPADVSLTIPLARVAATPTLVAATSRAAVFLTSGSTTTAGIVPASVATLTQGVLRTMIATRLKLAAAALLLITTGSAALLGQVPATGSNGGGPGPAPSAPNRTATASGESGQQVDLEMLERAWADAVNRRDTAFLDRLLAEDFAGIDHAGNTFDKPAALRDPLLGTFLTAAYAELEQIKARVFGETAIATSRFKVRDSAARGAMTHVYLRRGGRWQCVASHASWPTSGVCPAVGPISERTPTPAREGRNVSRPSDSMAANCVSCHRPAHSQRNLDNTAPTIAPTVGDGMMRRAFDFMNVAPGPHRPANERPATPEPFKLTLDAAGNTAIAGRIVPSRKDLEERLRAAAWAPEGTKLLAISVVGDVSQEVLRSIVEIADRAGYQGFSVIRASAGTTLLESWETTGPGRPGRKDRPGP